MEKIQQIAYKYFDLQEELFRNQVKEFNELMPCLDSEVFYMVKHLILAKNNGIIDTIEELNLSEEQFERLISKIVDNIPYKEFKCCIQLEKDGNLNFIADDNGRQVSNFLLKRAQRLTREEGSLKKKIKLLDKIIESFDNKVDYSFVR